MLTLYGRRVDEEELAALVLAWEEVFADITDAEFVAGCKAARKTSRYFPVPAEVRDAMAEMRGQVRNNHLALTEPTAPEKRWQGKIKGLMCIAQIAHKCSKEQAARVCAADQSIPWAEREKVARQVLGKDFPEFEDFMAEEPGPWQPRFLRENEERRGGPAVMNLPPPPVYGRAQGDG